MPSFERHEFVVTALPEGQRYTHLATCICNWQAHADSEGEAESLGQVHQANRGYVAGTRKLSDDEVKQLKDSVNPVKPTASQVAANQAAESGFQPVPPQTPVKPNEPVKAQGTQVGPATPGATQVASSTTVPAPGGTTVNKPPVPANATKPATPAPPATGQVKPAPPHPLTTAPKPAGTTDKPIAANVTGAGDQHKVTASPAETGTEKKD